MPVRPSFALTAAKYSVYTPVASCLVYCLTWGLGYLMDANGAQLLKLAYTNFYGAGLVNLSGFALGAVGWYGGGGHRRLRGIRLRSLFGMALNGVVLSVWVYLVASVV